MSTDIALMSANLGSNFSEIVRVIPFTEAVIPIKEAILIEMISVIVVTEGCVSRHKLNVSRHRNNFSKIVPAIPVTRTMIGVKRDLSVDTGAVLASHPLPTTSGSVAAACGSCSAAAPAWESPLHRVGRGRSASVSPCR
jgi:hypothetical protein